MPCPSSPPGRIGTVTSTRPRRTTPGCAAGPRTSSRPRHRTRFSSSRSRDSLRRPLLRPPVRRCPALARSHPRPRRPPAAAQRHRALRLRRKTRRLFFASLSRSRASFLSPRSRASFLPPIRAWLRPPAAPPARRRSRRSFRGSPDCRRPRTPEPPPAQGDPLSGRTRHPWPNPGPDLRCRPPPRLPGPPPTPGRQFRIAGSPPPSDRPPAVRARPDPSSTPPS